MSKSGSISMLLESCHPSICSLHFTFIHFKSTDMRLPADWSGAISSCSGLVLSQCLGYVNSKIKTLSHANCWGFCVAADVDSNVPENTRQPNLDSEVDLTLGDRNWSRKDLSHSVKQLWFTAGPTLDAVNVLFSIYVKYFCQFKESLACFVISISSCVFWKRK